MMSCTDNDINQHFQDAIDVIQQHSSHAYYDSYPCCLASHPADAPPPSYEWHEAAGSWAHWLPDTPAAHSVQTESPRYFSVISSPRSSKGRKKLRLYEYLHEALNDPNMSDSIQWTDSGSGIFHFISKNKEKLAECWGQRKGNRKTMTYQKMARALRNYSRTGEIIKVRRKLTYQFNAEILHRLGSGGGAAAAALSYPAAQEEAHPLQESPAQHGYCGSAGPDWHSWYSHYQLQEDYDLATSFTTTKL
ncbi:transcription factor Spi-C [Synchiropus splendidus]|uniref:transcription factor Spi-C n=1 Tax=Synchiropus splendidus TaxID=270530 RepID=UPI00237D6F36|nr:transcription factor Spi-C [Synchiropus splendidus]